MGADVNSQDEHGWTPLLLAAVSGATGVVELLLERHVILDQVDTKGNTALHLASRRDHVRVVELLLDHGAEVLLNDHGLTCLDVAMEQKNEDVVMAIVKHER